MVCNFFPVGIVFNGYRGKLARDGARDSADRKRDVKHQKRLDCASVRAREKEHLPE